MRACRNHPAERHTQLDTASAPLPSHSLRGDEGVAEAASEFETDLIEDVASNHFGTPLLNSAFDDVEERAVHSLLCYVDAHIILLSDFAHSVRQVAAVNRQFLMVGWRWDLDVSEELALEEDGWEAMMRRRVTEAGSMNEGLGMTTSPIRAVRSDDSRGKSRLGQLDDLQCEAASSAGCLMRRRPPEPRLRAREREAGRELAWTRVRP